MVMRVPTRKPGKYTHQEADPHITAAKLDELKKHLEHLKKVSQPQAIAETQRMAAHGDFSENAGYQVAKARLRGINNRMLEIEEYLKHAVVIEPNKDTSTVQLGHRVTIRSAAGEKTYTILGSTETNPTTGVISHSSPLGAALLGRRVGDVVTIPLARGKSSSCTITAIV